MSTAWPERLAGALPEDLSIPGIAPDPDLLGTILEGIGDPFYAVDSNWRVTIYNSAAARHFGRSPAEAIGMTLWDLVPHAFETPLGRRFREVMESGVPAVIEDMSVVATHRRVEGRLFPLRGGLGVLFRDTTEAWLAEQALRRREAELARVQEIANIGGLEVDLTRGFVNRRSPEYLRLHGLPASAATESHEDWVQRIHPADRSWVEAHFREAVAGEDLLYEAEYRIIRPSDGEERWIAASAIIERDKAGKAVRLVGVHHDITERKRAEGRRKLLVNELNHRVKNTLATIQAIGRQTLRGRGTAEENVRAFESRLMALSKAHDVLTREDWEGADIRDIVASTIRPFRGERTERILVEGDAARLKPSDALALAMALQELGTNALKYGSLSAEGGRVHLGWERLGEAPLLRVVWQETGGPPVLSPERRGFGSRLIERGLPGEFGQAVTLSFDPTGLRCEIRIPVATEADRAMSLGVLDLPD